MQTLETFRLEQRLGDSQFGNMSLTFAEKTKLQTSLKGKLQKSIKSKKSKMATDSELEKQPIAIGGLRRLRVEELSAASELPISPGLGCHPSRLCTARYIANVHSSRINASEQHKRLNGSVVKCSSRAEVWSTFACKRNVSQRNTRSDTSVLQHNSSRIGR